MTAVIGSTATATGAPADDAARQAPATAGGEYVVAFTGTPEEAAAAIQAAGGTVESVTAEVGVALVSSSDGAFLDRVRTRGEIRGAARNHAVGTARPDMPHRYAEERPAAMERAGQGSGANREPRTDAEPLSDLQWDMEMIEATPDGAHRRATGEGVDVGIIDTGIDGSHPDLAPNFDADRSRNFTTDIPDIDGPCEYEGCADPADVDHNGHGTHVAGVVAAADNDFGILGVAPDATLVNLRAGQDSGFFFLYETVAALVYAGTARLDVVNMSFYTDPWLYNCTSRDEYLEGDVTDEELAQQRLVRELVEAAVSFAHNRGVTLVGAAGNEHLDKAAPTRLDETSPDFPPDAARPRVVANTCLTMPNEAPQIISVTAVGPSTTKADYSSYGLDEVEIAAPGGFYLDFFGTPEFQTPGNLILSSYPLGAAIEQELADPGGEPIDEFSFLYCDDDVCGFYTYLQGTSMASPHVAGVAALVVEAHGRATAGGGLVLKPDAVERILLDTATDLPCPAAGVEDYTDEGRTPDFNAVCEGTTDENGLYGEGLVNAEAAVGGGH